jgi:hypothetical protein
MEGFSNSLREGSLPKTTIRARKTTKAARPQKNILQKY